MTSFGCHIVFMFPWMRTIIFVCKWKRLCTLYYANVCNIKCCSCKTFHEEYSLTKNGQLPCGTREAQAHSYIRTYRSAMMVVYIKYVLFLLIDRSVCIIQNNQILDVLVKYIANYHIWYSGQLEIRISVVTVVNMLSRYRIYFKHQFNTNKLIRVVLSFKISTKQYWTIIHRL